MKIIVAGGGTGGHIIPNLALLQDLKKEVQNVNVLYIGSKKGIEAKLIGQQNYPFKAISCGKLRRYFSIENFLDFFRVIFGIVQSILIINKFKPNIIFCKGGYVSLPVAIASSILNYPYIIHESDINLGLANKISMWRAKAICVSFPETFELLKNDKRVILTGNPVRAELNKGDKKRGFQFTQLKENGNPIILIMGGSQGSEFINNLVKKWEDKILDKYQIIQIFGPGKMPKEPHKKGYFKIEYIGEELKDVYAITDIIIGRAGANSLAEIEYLNIPAILIPLKHGSRGDQIDNAKSFINNHNALILDEDDKHIDLIEKLDFLIKFKQKSIKKQSTSPASMRIVNILLDLAKVKYGK